MVTVSNTNRRFVLFLSLVTVLPLVLFAVYINFDDSRKFVSNASESGTGSFEPGIASKEHKNVVTTSNNTIPSASTPSDHVAGTQQYLEFVHNQCKKYSKTTPDRPKMSLPRNNEQYRILYAGNPKTGSTSFKKWFLRIQGSDVPYIQMHGVNSGRCMSFNQLKDLHPNTSLPDLIAPYFKVGFVRNPCLLSGFRDKVLRRSWYENQLYKRDPSTDVEKFRVFVDLVVNNKVRNMHWFTQWNRMQVCGWPFDLLAQTATQQIKIVQEHTGTEAFEFPGSRAEQGQDSTATVQLAHEFYDSISQGDMEKFYKRYLWDFVLMGYTKLDHPDFPYVDLSQDFENNFKASFD